MIHEWAPCSVHVATKDGAGTADVPGYSFGPLAIHAMIPWDGDLPDGRWTITHRASGLAVIMCSNEVNARAVAQGISDRAWDWPADEIKGDHELKALVIAIADEIDPLPEDYGEDELDGAE